MNAPTTDFKKAISYIPPIASGIAILSLFFILDITYFGVTVFENDIYSKSSPFLAALTQMPFAGLLFLSTALLAWGWRKIRWQDIDSSGAVRGVVLLSAGIIAWAFSCYEVNYFYNQLHLLDRFLVAIFFLGLIFHPGFISLFLLASLTILGQFDGPVSSIDWIDKIVIFKMLILFNAALFVKLRIDVSAPLMLFLLVCLFSANYYFAGVSKLLGSPNWTEWLTKDELHNLVVSAYLAGWNLFSTDSELYNYIPFLKSTTPLLLWGTVIIEICALFTLAHRHMLGIFCMMRIGFHVSIFILTGVFFWKWILVNVLVLYYCYRDRSGIINEICSRKYFAASLVLILFSYYTFRPVRLSWFDTRFFQYYKSYAIDENNLEYEIGTEFFAPYDMAFAQARFSYLVQEPTLVDCFGTNFQYDIAKYLMAGSSVEDIPKLKEWAKKRKLGVEHYNPEGVATFNDFISKFTSNKLAAKNKGGFQWSKFFELVGPPNHIMQIPRENPFEYQVEVKSVRTRYREVYFDSNKIIHLQNKPVLETVLSKPN